MDNVFKIIPKDKWMHFGCCFGISLIVSLFSILISMHWGHAMICGFLVAMGAGLGKEYADKVNPRNFWDWYDVLADTVGSIVGAMLGVVCFL